ncbi:MAG: NUDIX domain-containing protein [Prolixibacteraceae bacterium]|nr:NUDIX domain-containing protein [Prolixibacteraceae bacterium]
MYKVFFNDRRIIISQKANITISKSKKAVVDLLTMDDVIHRFLEFIDGNKKELFIETETPDYFWQNVFIPSFRFIKAAGGIVVRNNQMLFIYRDEKWDLPKGKIDVGETEENAALREVEEECGISGHSIVKRLPSTFHIYQSPYKKSKGEWILKETVWFEMAYSGNEDGTPQADENIKYIRWCKSNELNEAWNNTYENLKQIISLYFD